MSKWKNFMNNDDPIIVITLMLVIVTGLLLFLGLLFAIYNI